MTTRIVIFADKRLAYARLEAPVFTKNQQLATLGMTPVLASPRLGCSPTDYGSPRIFSAYGKLLACYATSTAGVRLIGECQKLGQGFRELAEESSIVSPVMIYR